MKKWSLRIVVGVVALVLLLLAAVQVVLWTSMPRQWVLSAIQQKLQLKVSAQSFSTGWGGRTSLSDVTLGLPLAEESFLQTPSLSVEHTGLLALLVGRPLEIKSVTIDRPNVLVRQMPDGRWNLQEVAELLSRASGGKAAEGSPPQARTGGQGGPPQLPKVTIRDGTIRVIDLAGRQSTLHPLDLSGAPDGPLVWRLELTEADRLKVTGEIAPGADWSHQADIELKNLGPLIKPLLASPSPSTVQALEQFKLSGHWTGRAAGTLGGRLDLKELFVGGGWGATASGPVNLSFADGVVTILPGGLVITPPKRDAEETIPPARAASGAIYLDGHSATIKDLSLGFAGGEVRVGGSYAWDRGAGRIEAWWNKLAYPAGLIHGGTLTASLSQPWPDQPVIHVDLITRGHRGEADTWNAQLDLSGKGLAWDQIDWTLKAPKLTYEQPAQAYNLDGINAKLATRGRVVTLDGIDVPPGNLYGKWKRGKLEGQGRYDMTTQQWFAYVTGTGWPVSPTASTPADFLVDVYGDGAWARLKHFFMEGAGVQVTATGDIAYRAAGMPADLHVYTKAPPVNYVWRERGADPRDDVKLAGRLYSEVHVTGGAARPMRLDITGKLFAHDFTTNGHPVGDVVMRVSGRANDDALTLATERLKLFGGEWDFDARYQWQDRLTKVHVALAQMSLEQLDKLLKPPPSMRGTLEGRWAIAVPEFDLNRMTVDGEYTARRVAKVNAPPPTTLPSVATAARNRDGDRQAVQATLVRGPQAQSPPRTEPPPPPPPVRTTADASSSRPATTAPTTQPSIMPIADLITGKVAGADGIVTFDPIQLRLRGGRTDAKASFAVTAPRQVHLEMVSAAWPSDFTDRRGRPNNVLVWLNTTLDLDLKKLEAKGPLHLQRAVVSNAKQTIAEISAEADVLGRRLDVRTITGKGLGGSIAGDGYVYLDSPLQSSGRLDWKDIDAESITALLPATAGLVGKFSGAATFAPVTVKEDRDAAGPFKVTGTITADHAAINHLQIGNATFTLYGDYERSVLKQFDWNIAGGTMHGWARFTNYRGDKFAHVNLSFENLDLDQIVYATRPPEQDHKPVPGRVAGHVTAAGNPFTPRGQREASGDAMIRLTDSDLANVSIVNALYTILSVKWGQAQPTGHGFVQARLEGQRLEIPVARYSNRGVDIWANPAVVDIFKGRESPIEGTAAGSARPLKDLKLPFMGDVDKVLAALQGGLATVRIEGTVKDPKPRVIPFSAAGDTFRRFMLGEVKEATKGTAGR